MGARNNRVESELQRLGDREPFTGRAYDKPAVLIDSQGRRSTFYFCDDGDRAEFVRLFEVLHTKHGHQTRAEVIE